MSKLPFFFIAILMTALYSLPAMAQKGVISGKVVDKATGETLIGASVYIEGVSDNTIGTITDFDGNYSFDTDPGTYDIAISYISYTKQLIKGVVIKAGDVTTLDAALEGESVGLTEVVVQASAVKNTDASLIALQKKSFSIQDGISSQQISRTGSSNAADAMKQMTGAVVEDGKFIVMRGLGDRYSLSQLNGVTMPSTDPYRNSSSLDLIPSQMIENIVTTKTFTPDLPANFSGGLVNVTTKSLPDKFTLHFELSGAYNTQASLIDNFLSQKAGETDWLGLDDGSRDQPALLLDEAVRNRLSSSTYLDARKRDSVNVRNIFHESSRALSHEFVPTTKSSPLNHGLNFSIGDRYKLFGKDLGFTLGINYSRNFNHYENATVATYINNNSTQLFDYQALTETRSVENPHLGALFNLSYKLSNNDIINANVIFNNDADLTSLSQTGRYLGQVSDATANFNTNSIGFTQRQFTTYQLSGRHVFTKLNKIEIEWLGSASNSFQREPDLRYFAYTVSPDEEGVPQYYINNSEIAFPYHFFRDLQDDQLQGKIDITIPFLTRGNPGSSNRIKLGGMYSSTQREFEEYRYQMNNTGVPSTRNFTAFGGKFEDFFNNDNFGIIDTVFNTDGSVQRYTTGWHYINQINNRNFYTGEQTIIAAYLMAVYNLTPRLKFVGGLRMETTDMSVISRDVNVPEGKIDLTDFPYSASLIYSLSEKANLRLAATQTLARPNLRELAPFEQFDTKNGFFSLGNPDLDRTLIQNYDLRYELYPRSGELLAISAFYKQFDNAIVRAFVPQATIPELKFINVKDAEVYGIEVEFRKQLNAISPALEHFYFSTNFAIIQSSYPIPQDEIENSRNVDTTYTTTTRPFQGQAPFIANAILTYLDSEKGWESSIAFNVSGRKLYNIALRATPDIYEEPAPQLDFKISKRFGKNYSVAFTARNILNPMFERTQTYKGVTYIADSYQAGTLLGFNVAYFIR
ncbi:MAG: TonB-dependent receptor [Saprospiraceae bacterium]|nr:TonB-dependent receptor [Saprospiraceae bacterium]MDZ4706280.1 TonB-dependent receptor [Saprospiraceae bacterium]